MTGSERRTDDDLDQEAARVASKLRARGLGYREIGAQLGVSGGEAHHLVAEAQGLFDRDVDQLLRPPGRVRRKDVDRARELHTRLRHDYERARTIALNHVDTDTEAGTLQSVRIETLDSKVGELDLAARLLGEKPRGEVLEGQPTTGADAAHALGVELPRLRAAFMAMLKLATGLDATLRDQETVDVLAVFDRDLDELRKLAGLEVGQERVAQGAEKLTAQVEVAERARVQLSRPDRDQRDQGIVEARLRGVPVREVAGSYGLTQRQVRRIVSKHRAGKYAGAEAAVEAVDDRNRVLSEELRHLEQKLEIAPTDHARSELLKRQSKVSAQQIELLRLSGILSPDLGAALVRNLGRFDVKPSPDSIASINRIIKVHLSDAGVKADVIEGLIDKMIEDSGADIVQA